MKFSRKYIFGKISTFFYCLAALLAILSTYAGVSTHGNGWAELFLFDIALAGVFALLGLVFGFFSDANNNTFITLMSKIKSIMVLPKFSFGKLSLKKRQLNINPKVCLYLYALYFFIALYWLLEEYCGFNNYIWSEIIIYCFIYPLILWGTIMIVAKYYKRNGCPLTSNANIVSSADEKIYYSFMWDFEEWAKDKIITIAPYYDFDKETFTKACYFTSKFGGRETVRFSEFIGELTPSQIFKQKEDLRIFRLSNGEYMLSTMNDKFESDGWSEAFDF